MTYKIRIKTFVCAERPAATGEAVTSPEDARRVLARVYAELDADREHFVVLALNAEHKVIGFKIVSSGTSNATLVRPVEAFRIAFLLPTACAVIFAHNHPSGRTQPSEDDVLLARRLTRVGVDLGVQVLDHLILTGSGFTSYN